MEKLQNKRRCYHH